MIIESGFIVFVSLIIIFWQMPKELRLWLLGHPLWIHVPFGLLAYILHYGTFSGMMAAAVAVCICWAFVELMRKLVGYKRNDQYHPGAWTS